MHYNLVYNGGVMIFSWKMVNVHLFAEVDSKIMQ